MKRKPLTTELPDSFDTLLRAAVDISDVPLAAPSVLTVLPDGATLGAGRFRICRLIGRGGMGVVYEAEDRDSHTRVALKVLNRVEPKGIKRFKDEFRILADTIHPNLVRLRDLFMEDGIWFFTMDLIDGGTLSAHLAAVGPVGSAEREHELRRLLAELVDGVAAIHATGHLHRDLKPANVLVSGDGCVVIVDFGLVGDFSRSDNAEGALPVVGTASHMAPEQARGEPAATASDWYAVGTIAYEALTGQTPIDGGSAEVLLRKRRSEDPRLFADRGPWPEDLVELCRSLLAQEPNRRPDHAAILRCLGAPGTSPPSVVAEPRFVGRAHELGVLEEALRGAERGLLVVCRITGSPGIGKTAFVREFLSRASREHDAIVLSGRCYEREETPFKLLDGLVDSLSESLERHVSQARDVLLPLAPLFLGLAVEPARNDAAHPRSVTEPEVRSRAVQAFRKGLGELATRGTVILHIDDVQWCDADGVALLDEVLETPAPPALLILTARDDEVNDALRALWQSRFLSPATVRDVHLEGLPTTELVAIVNEMARGDHALDADAIAHESEGSPYFATEMIRHALEQHRAGAHVHPATTLTLGHTIRSRFRNLPGAAQRVLEALSLCDGPTPVRLLEAATGVDDVERAVAVLRSATFARTRRLRDTPTTEPYHDRVREEIHHALTDSERRTLHIRLARAFETLAPHASEQMLHHFEAAGDLVNASAYAKRSAERAAQAQAFERAAALYQRALRLGTWRAADQQKLYERLGDALASCAHNAEAAEAYERAAAGAAGADCMRLQVLGASQLLCSGDVLSGVERLTESLGYLGVRIPEENDMLPRLAACIDETLAEASGVVYRDEASIESDRLLRIDACWWAAKGLRAIHHSAATFLMSVHLLEAVRAGEPMRIARGAYAQAALCSAAQWEHLAPIVEATMQVGDAAAARAPSANARFWRHSSLAWQYHFAFDLNRAAAHVEAAYEHADAGGHGLENEMALLSILEAVACLARFENPKELGRPEIWKRDALRRGDRSLAAWMCALDAQWWLTDTPEAFRADLIALLSELKNTFGDEQFLVWAVEAVLAWVERYLDLTSDAFGRMRRVLERARASPSWVVPRSRVTLGIEYVACAIADAEARGRPVPKDAEAILAEFPTQVSGIVDLLRAGLTHVNGDRDEAIRLLERAEADPGMERTRIVAAGARYSRGRLLGGSQGDAIVREELDNLRASAANPKRLFESWWPGFRVNV